MNNNNISVADELLKLNDLLEKEIITKEEFNDLKSRLINNSGQQDSSTSVNNAQNNLKSLREKVSEDELIVEIKDTNEYKIISKTEYETAKELDLAKYYYVVSEGKKDLNRTEISDSEHRFESIREDDFDNPNIESESNTEKKKSYFNKSTILFISLFILLPAIVYFTSNDFVNSNDSGGIPKDSPTIEVNSIKTPSLTSFKFVLTRLNGRELERSAYFYCGDTNPFKLDLRDGNAPFKYFISGGLGDMCGLYGKDQYGKAVSICITKLSGDNSEVEIKYSDKTMRFTGYFSR